MKKLIGIFVVIGLVVWGISAGQDLIAGAERRAATREGAQQAASTDTPAQAVTSPAKEVARSTAHDEGKDIAWVEHMQDKVRERLKDPESAEFRKARVYRGFNNIPAVCGEVNAKNAFGGYNGFSGFIAGGDLVFVEQDMASGEFQKSWKQICRD